MKNHITGILLAACMLTISTAHSKIITETVRYTISQTEYTSYISYDDSIREKRPGVLVVHEWWGLNAYARQRMEMLAELGYVALAVDMYGTGKVTDNPDQARTWMQEATADVEWWRETATAGIERLKQHPLVDASRIAAIGYCFGGGTVIQLAYGGIDIAGVVSFHGSLPAADESSFGNIKARMLIAHGNADSFIPRETLTRFQDTLDQAGANWNMITYGNARHGFTNPNAHKRGMEALEYNAYADKHSWQAMKTFFDEIFR